MNESIGNIKLTDNFWDCECMINYIHPKTERVCKLCKAEADDSPDSRINEVMDTMKNVTRMVWHGMSLVKISDAPGFLSWLSGQTCPMVEDDPNPFDWAYADDFDRYVRGLPIID
jgi:hypothetical protein